MKFKFSLQAVLNHREILEKNAEIAFGKEVQKLTKMENELELYKKEYYNLVKSRGGIDTKSSERFMDFIIYINKIKETIAVKKEEIEEQKKQVENARQELIKKTQEKKAIEVLRDSQKAAFKLAEKRLEAKQTDEAAGQRFNSKKREENEIA